MIKKLLVFVFLFSIGVILGGCGFQFKSSGTLKKDLNHVSISDIHTGNKHLWTKITGNVTLIDKEFDQMIQLMKDLQVQEKKYSLLYSHDEHTSIIVQSGNTSVVYSILDTTTGTLLQAQKDGVVLWQSNQKTDIIGQLLGMDKKITAIYGPFEQSVQPTFFALYTTENPYGQGFPKQYVFDLITKTSYEASGLYIYRTNDNGLLKTIPLAGDHLFSGITYISKTGSIQLLTGGIDSFFFDGYRLYTTRIVQGAEQEYAVVNIIDISTRELLTTIQNIPIGRDPTFFLQNNILTAFYGVPDFANETTSIHALRYDLEKKQVVWEIKINEKE